MCGCESSFATRPKRVVFRACCSARCSAARSTFELFSNACRRITAVSRDRRITAVSPDRRTLDSLLMFFYEPVFGAFSVKKPTAVLSALTARRCG